MYKKNEPATLRTGTIISDLSDHIINFILFPVEKSRTSLSNKGYFLDRIINKNTKEKFHEVLNNLQWNNVTCQNDVNLAYDEFWNTFSALYDFYLPITKIKFTEMYTKLIVS